MSYKCKKCGKLFKYDYLLLRHMKRKTPCKKINNNNDKMNENDNDNNININNNIDELEIKIKTLDDNINDIYNKSLKNGYVCNFCNKEFKLKGNLKRHMDINCEDNKKMLADKNILLFEKKIFNKYIEKNKNYLTENNNKNNKNNIIDKNKKNINTVVDNNKNININNTNNTIHNNTINLNFNINNTDLKLNPFGKEDFSHITSNEYKKILSTFFSGFIDYIKKIHFDDRMPSNHNVYISKINSKFAYIYEDNQWNLKKKDDILDKIISRKRISLNDKCNELYDSGIIDDTIVNLNEEFNKNYYDGSDETEKILCDDIELLLYNYKNKILEKKNDIKSLK